MMYDTGHGPTFSDTQNRRLRKMEGEGAAQAGLWDRWWFHLAPRRKSRPIKGNSKVFSCERSGPSSRSIHVRRWGGRFPPDLIGLSSPTAKVTSSLMLEGPRFPTVFRSASYRLRRNAEALWHCECPARVRCIVSTGHAIMPRWA